MEALTLHIVIFIGIAIGLTSLAIWSPRKFWVKTCGVVLFAAFTVAGYLSFADLLSRPKPVKLEFAKKKAAEARVLGAKIAEGKGIYLLLELPDFPEPRYYRLPWSRNLAQELQNEMGRARREGRPLMFRLPFEPTWDRKEPMFYPMPQAAEPPKDPAPGGPMILEPSPRNKERL